ncbi:MAG: alpha/beta fold hydrolase [Oligoflexia bacterium]|nr:alpha/beta fold hydrolase [Oligoflexia bacterium]MBF0365721.1 alpha/beta fold hydrolase [Oligoflexia bacterium]
MGDQHELTLRDGLKLHLEISERGHNDWIVFTHGIGEHCGRHRYLLNRYCNRFNIALYDLRGHGASEGKRTKIHSFNDYIDDLRELLEFLERDYRMESGRFILYGHSMGALIVSTFVQRVKLNYFAPLKVILSGPPVVPGNLLGKLLASIPTTTKYLAKYWIDLPLRGLVDLHYLSHDTRIYEEYMQDPKNVLAASSHLLLNLIHTACEVYSRPLGLRQANIPLAVVLGSEDKIIDVLAARKYFSSVEIASELLVIKDAYHELHNEIERYREEYFTFIDHFISS